MTKNSKPPTSNLRAFASYSRQALEDWLESAVRDDREAVLHLAEPSRRRICALTEELKGQFYQRDEAIEAVVDSLVSSVPAVLIGPPGTAKSRIVGELARLCGLGTRAGGEDGKTGLYFEYLLTAHTMPEELFGPPNIADLRKGEFSRRMEGMLPKADIAFLDEVFRGGSHILNTLLSVLNERKFHDGKSVHQVPLTGILAAANHPPTSADEAALYDRFPVRIWVESVFEGEGAQGQWLDAAQALVTKASKLELREISPDHATEPPIACVNDFRIARRASFVWRQKHSTRAKTEPFLKLFMNIREEVGLSDRALFQLLRVASAEQWRSERQFDVDHVKSLCHVADSRERRRHIESSVRRAVHGASMHGHA